MRATPLPLEFTDSILVAPPLRDAWSLVGAVFPRVSGLAEVAFLRDNPHSGRLGTTENRWLDPDLHPAQYLVRVRPHLTQDPDQLLGILLHEAAHIAQWLAVPHNPRLAGRERAHGHLFTAAVAEACQLVGRPVPKHPSYWPAPVERAALAAAVRAHVGASA